MLCGFFHVRRSRVLWAAGPRQDKCRDLCRKDCGDNNDCYVECKQRCFSKEIIDARYATAVRAATEGPAGLGPRERMTLLEDAGLMTFVHEGVWALPDGDSAERWGLA